MGKNLKGKELGRGISQRKDGRYSARFVTAMGKRVEKYFIYAQDARRWLAEARMADDPCSENHVCYGMTVNDWYEFWIHHIKAKTVKPNTLRNYKERYEKNIKKKLGKMLINDVRPYHCQLVLNAMAEDYAGSTIHQTLLALYCLFQDAVENGIVLSNPVKKTVKIPKPIVKRTRVLTVEEQRLFMEAAKDTRNYPQYFFVLQTGVRTGEMIGLKWEDLDFENDLIHIRRTMEYRYSVGEWRIGTPKTKKSVREIPMTQPCKDLLLEIREKVQLGKFVLPEYQEFVFINRNGMPTKNSTYDAHLQKISESIGIEKFSMHALRHTFATRCIEAGMRPKTLQQLLGHSDINITMNLYVHVTDDEKKKEIKKLEDYVVKMA